MLNWLLCNQVMGVVKNTFVAGMLTILSGITVLGVFSDKTSAESPQAIVLKTDSTSREQSSKALNRSIDTQDLVLYVSRSPNMKASGKQIAQKFKDFFKKNYDIEIPTYYDNIDKGDVTAITFYSCGRNLGLYTIRGAAAAAEKMIEKHNKFIKDVDCSKYQR